MTGVEESMYTVAGHILETGERYKTLVTAGSSEMAEQVAHNELLERGGHLLPAMVAEGDVPNVDRYQWIDPSVTSQEQMDARLVEMGWVSAPTSPFEDGDGPQGQAQPRRIAVAMAVMLLVGLIVGVLIGAVAL